ncbi:MAG: stage III sporulation protein AE, partial [Clostridium sp.]
AITTVVGYSVVLKDALSIVGLIIMIFICIFPLLKIMIITLIYKFVASVMEPVVDRKIIDCLSSVGGSFTVIFSSLLCVAIMFFIMITIITTTGRLIMTVG